MHWRTTCASSDSSPDTGARNHPVAVFVEIVRFPRYLRPPVEQVAQNVVGHESSRVEIEAEEYVDPLGPIFTSEIERRVTHPVVHDLIEVIMCKRIIQRRIAVTVRIVLVFEIGVGVLHEQVETGPTGISNPKFPRK